MFSKKEKDEVHHHYYFGDGQQFFIDHDFDPEPEEQITETDEDLELVEWINSNPDLSEIDENIIDFEKYKKAS